MKKIKATVSGKVQGVGFRMSTQSLARQLGVSGYVRNLTNGDVEIVAFGETEKVDQLLTWAELGPSSAVVNNLKVESVTDGAEFEGFEIRR
ncbi:acylphosphatase [Myxosarcina sp. GI1(2024)]